MHEWPQFLDWAFQGIVAGAIVIGVSVLRELRDSVSDLNENVAVVIEKTAQHERQLEKHDERIRELEVKP